MAAFVFEEEICDGGYEGEAVSSNKVLPFLRLHALSGPAAKQSKVDIKSHGKSPEGVNAQEPVGYQKSMPPLHLSRLTSELRKPGTGTKTSPHRQRLHLVLLRMRYSYQDCSMMPRRPVD